MTSEEMAGVAAFWGMGISLVFNLTPKLKDKFDELSPERQQLSMIIMMAITAILITLRKCTDPVFTNGQLLSCTDPSTWWQVGTQLVSTFLAGAVTNQGVDRITPKGKDKKTSTRRRVAPRKAKASP